MGKIVDYIKSLRKLKKLAQEVSRNEKSGLSDNREVADSLKGEIVDLLLHLELCEEEMKEDNGCAGREMQEDLDNGCTKILVIVKNGLVEEVYCTDQNAEVLIDDHDVQEDVSDDDAFWLDGSPVDKSKLTLLY